MPTIFDAIQQKNLTSLMSCISESQLKKDGKTPIEIARNLGWWDGVKVIAQHLIDNQSVNPQILGDVLVTAAETEEWELVKLLVKAGAVLTWFTPSNGYSALHWAIEAKRKEMVALLLENKATLNAFVTESGSQLKTPMFIAVRKGDWEIIRLLIREVKPTTFREDPFELGAALVIAARDKYIKDMRELLQKGAALTWQTIGDRNTSLHHAVLHKDMPMLDLLLNYGALSSVTNEDGFTPWQLAIDTGFWEGAEKILKNKKFNEEELKTASLYFLKAVKAGQVEVAQLCLDAGADVNACDDAGENAYHAAVRSGLLKSLNFVSTLKKNFSRASQNKNGQTSIELATSLATTVDHWSLVQQLFWVKDKRLTPEELHLSEALRYAIEKGNYFITQILLEAGASCNRVDSQYGNIAIGLAIKHNQPKILELLLDHGADPTSKDAKGNDSYEAANSSPECKKVLIAHRNALNNNSENVENLRVKIKANHQLLIKNLANNNLGLKAKEILDIFKELFKLHKEVLELDLLSLKELVINFDMCNDNANTDNNNESITVRKSDLSKEKIENLINLIADLLNPQIPFVSVTDSDSNAAQYYLPKTSLVEVKDIAAYLNFGDAYRYHEYRIHAFLRDLGFALATTRWQKKNRLGTKFIDGMPDHVELIAAQLERANKPVSSFDVLDIFAEVTRLLKEALDKQPKGLGERTQETIEFYSRQLGKAEFIFLNLLPVKAFPAYPQLSTLLFSAESAVGVPSNTGFFAPAPQHSVGAPPPYPGLR